MALQPAVVIGADTHLDTIHLAALDSLGKPLADSEFRTCPRGYAAAMVRYRSGSSFLGKDSAAQALSRW
ncbi:MAG: hypothetical protein KIH64_015520 [Mycobacterium sp.]|nr:hypothetical protein [Mycobacterium sp.]